MTFQIQGSCETLPCQQFEARSLRLKTHTENIPGKPRLARKGPLVSCWVCLVLEPLAIPNANPEALNSEFQTLSLLNPKPKTLDPKPESSKQVCRDAQTAALFRRRTCSAKVGWIFCALVPRGRTSSNSSKPASLRSLDTPHRASHTSSFIASCLALQTLRTDCEGCLFSVHFQFVWTHTCPIKGTRATTHPGSQCCPTCPRASPIAQGRTEVHKKN